jgi:hypothetical protein
MPQLQISINKLLGPTLARNVKVLKHKKCKYWQLILSVTNT